MVDHGISPRDLAILAEVLTPWRDRIERIGLFGSRATGKFRTASDIDLVLHGAMLTQADADRMFTLLDESTLSSRVDLAVWHLIESAPLRRHVEAVERELELPGPVPRSAPIVT
jgi:uncharacterized protein